MSVLLSKPHPQIYLVTAETPAELGRMFVRLQEFYESPSPLFRRRFFTLAKFKAWYSRYQSRTGRFTYYSDYYGYNVPSHVLEAFFCLYSDSLTKEELALLRIIGDTPRRFYVIGAPEKSESTIDHELSHAFFYLFPDYRELMISLQHGHDLVAIRRYLKKNMYADDVMADEIAAYVMFNDALLHRAGISTKALRPLQEKLLDVYRPYRCLFGQVK